MDEWVLNDLLECSVCLERLDTSSKVLPCQHTFCRKCLEDILSTNKELRCPECRVLVDIKIDDLPPNVLLMRILEGMRNAGPRKRNSTVGSLRLPGPGNVPPSGQPSSLPPIVTNTNHESRVLPQPTAAVKMPNQPYARAVYDYLSKEPGDLTFKKGDIIMLRKKIDNNWYHGESAGKQGVFPLSYVQIVTPLPSHIPQCKALYDFRMTNDEDEGCLTFNKGEVITVLRRVDENWAEGKLSDRIGIFPLAFVEMNSIARAIMKLSTNAQPGPSRLAPPTPTTEDVTPLIPTDHSRGHTQPQSLPTIPVTSGAASDSSSSTTLTSPSSSSSSTPATSSTPSSPASPSSPPPPTVKRHSFNMLHHPQNRHSAEILSPPDVTQEPPPPQSNSSVADRLRRVSEIPPPQGSPHASLQLPAPYVALYPYKPQKADELELKRGSVYTVTERCQDGWFKGTASRNHKSGVFPGNYVAPAKSLSALQAQVKVFKPTQKNTPQQPSPRTTVSYTRQLPTPAPTTLGGGTAPELPPRSVSPAVISASWHGNSTPHTLEGENSSPMHQSQPTPSPHSVDKVKEKKPVSLMRRLTNIKKSRSPPPSYSMDNPVFEDGSLQVPQVVHVRSGSCPSQLLQVLPLDGSSPHHRMPRAKHRPLTPHHARSERSEGATPTIVSSSSAPTPTHRKSNSLDGSDRKSKQLVPPVRERFRCIVPYPPNSEYELELRVGDVIYVHRKRDDGWYKGTQQRTGKTGLFPASFVESF